MEELRRPPQRGRESQARGGREDDATLKGDALPDTLAQCVTRDAALDQTIDGAGGEGLSWHGVVLEAEGPESDRRERRPEGGAGGGERRGLRTTLHVCERRKDTAERESKLIAKRERTRPLRAYNQM